MEVPAASPWIACGKHMTRRRGGESWDLASAQYHGFSIEERGDNFPIRLPCGVLLLIVRIYLWHADMLYLDSLTYVLVIYRLLICSSSCYYKSLLE
jgi:hypothetical protein